MNEKRKNWIYNQYIHVKVTTWMYEKIHKEAKKHNSSVANLIRRCVEHAVNEKDPTQHPEIKFGNDKND